MSADGPLIDRYDDALAAEVYDLAHAHGPIGGADFEGVWLPLARECGSPILELGCGSGRLLIPLARQGFEVAGLDASVEMLRVAGRKLGREPAEVRRRAELIHADMRHFDLHRRFRLAFAPFNTFQLLLERTDQESALRCGRMHLAAGGRFALSVFHPRHDLLASPGGKRCSRTATRTDPATGRSLETYHVTTYDVAGQSFEAVFHMTLREPDGRVRRFRERMRMRYFFRFEMELLLEKAGLSVERMYGDFRGRPFRSRSPQMIFVCGRSRGRRTSPGASSGAG
jgi:SAM-dependent methyltransferase